MKSNRQLDAHALQNTNCVDCGARPYAGGMRCWSCFKSRCDQRRRPHEADVAPSVAGYKQGCRCDACRSSSASERRAQRMYRGKG